MREQAKVKNTKRQMQCQSKLAWKRQNEAGQKVKKQKVSRSLERLHTSQSVSVHEFYIVEKQEIEMTKKWLKIWVRTPSGSLAVQSLGWMLHISLLVISIQL